MSRSSIWWEKGQLFIILILNFDGMADSVNFDQGLCCYQFHKTAMIWVYTVSLWLSVGVYRVKTVYSIFFWYFDLMYKQILM